MKILKFIPFFFLIGVLVFGAGEGPSFSVAAEKNGMVVKDAWSRARPPSAAVGGAFMTLHNMEEKADRLVAAESPVADRVEIHNSIMKDGIMKMMQMEELVIPAGEMVMLKPGGFHVMLMGLKKPLTEGTDFPVTLDFAHAGKITVTVHVKEAGAMDMKKHGHQHKHD